MAAGVVAVPVAGLAVAALTLNPDTLKPMLADAVQAATGRVLHLDGPLRIRWSLWPTIQVNQVSLDNAPGGSRPDMAHAERIAAQISLPALLSHQLDVMELTLIGPNILFERAGDRPNWVFDGGKGKSSFTLRVRAVHVQNGMVTLRLPGSTRVVGLRAVDVRYPARRLSLAGVFVYGDNQPFALRVAASATGQMFGPWQTDIGFDAFDTTAQARGTMTLRGEYDLDVTGRSGALEKLNALLPEMQLPPVHGLSLSAHLASTGVLGAAPVVGPASVAFDSAAADSYVAGLSLGHTELSLAAPGGQAAVTSGGRYGTHPFTVRGKVQVPRALDAPGPLAVDLAAASGGVSGTVRGTVRVEDGGFGGLNAAVALRAQSLAEAGALAALSLPALKDVRVSGQVTMPGDLMSVRVAGAVLASEAGSAQGDLSFRRGKDGPAVQARLHSERIDADRLDAVFGGGGGGLHADSPLPWTQPGGAALDLAFDAAQMLFHGEDWRGVALTLQRAGGHQLGTVRLALPAGPLAVSFTTDAAAPMPASLSVHAPGVPLSLLARLAELPGSAEGSAMVDVQLHGAGRTLRALAGSLDGSVAVSAVGGRMSNETFRALTSGALSALGITVPPQGETALRCLGLAGVAKGGVLRLRTIALETSYLTLDGAGEVDLGNETLRLKLHPLVEVAGSKVAAPVIVDGPFGHVSGRLDADGLDKVGLLIDGLFGGDRVAVCRDAGLAG